MYTDKEIEKICEIRNLLSNRKARTRKFEMHVKSGKKWIEAIRIFESIEQKLSFN